MLKKVLYFYVLSFSVYIYLNFKAVVWNNQGWISILYSENVYFEFPSELPSDTE